MKNFALGLALIGALTFAEAGVAADSTANHSKSPATKTAHPAQKKGLAHRKFRRPHPPASPKGVTKPGKKMVQPGHKWSKPSGRKTT